MKKIIILLLLIVPFIFSCEKKDSPDSSIDVVEDTDEDSSLTDDSTSPVVSQNRGASQGRDILPGYTGFWERDTSYLDIIDLIEFYPDQLPFIRNEIYARYGRPFVNQVYRDYFNSKSWYQERSDFSDSWLSQTDLDNAEFVAAFEREAQKDINGIIEKVLRNIEYTGNSAVLTFISRNELNLSDSKADFGPYGVSNFSDGSMNWIVWGDWILAYRESYYNSFHVSAYILNHDAKRIVAASSRDDVNREDMLRLIRTQGGTVPR